MRSDRRSPIAACLLAAGAALIGCAGGAPAPTHITVLEPLPLYTPVVTLGAGDALGRAVFIHDIILAAAQNDGRAPVIVDAPVFFELDAEAR